MKGSRTVHITAIGLAVGIFGLLIGCAGQSSTRSTDPVPPTDTETETPSTAPIASDGDKTASWVNILEVTASGDPGAYTFAVQFESSDIDCTQFANWWEVVTEDGTLLYRRILAHPHTVGLTGNPVTRSGGPVEVTEDQTVIVRGHMNNAGYIGIPMRGSVRNGFKPAADLDATFAPTLASDAPQPETCISETDIVGDSLKKKQK